MSITRRDFLSTSATTAAGLALGAPAAAETTLRALAEPGAPTAVRSAGRPVVISAANGLTTDPNGKKGIKVAYDMLVNGADPLDAIVAGVNIVELDPNDQSVGLGGLPNEEGVVQLDASCMHGPTKRAGAVGCLENIATPSLVAKAVMDYTDHVFLVGEGARKFAVEMGFKEQNLLTEQSRQDWLRWKSRLNPNDAWLDAPPRDRPAPPRPKDRDEETGHLHVWYDAQGVPHTYGTINMNAVDAKGDIASVTTTSGLSWKIPGRVGDSPIIGAGQYCDNDVGAAGSTGRGEAAIKVCGSFLAVEFMRQGMSPEQALMKVIERVIAMTEKRLLDPKGRPYFDLNFYAVNKKGEFAGASAYESTAPDQGPFTYAVCDAAGPRMLPMTYLWKASERPRDRQLTGTMIKP
jgi:N4-(beta-N-acetylglucosaminyl)-L-asparaginase